MKIAKGKTGVPVFLFVHYSFCVIEKIMKQQKNPHAGFSLSIFQVRVRFLRRRSAGAEHPNVRKMRFAIIRGDSRLVFSQVSTPGTHNSSCQKSILTELSKQTKKKIEKIRILVLFPLLLRAGGSPLRDPLSR